MPSLYESTVNTGEVSSSNFTTLYNASGLQVPNAGAGSVTGNLNVGGNLTVQGSSLLIGEVTLQSTLSLPNYTFPLPDGSTFQVLVTDGNGNLYWDDVSAIPGADYNISATTVSGGANLTLANTAGFTDSVKFASGTNITVSRTDANTITISTTADDIPSGTAQGQVLYWNGSAWTASSNITSAAANDRLIVQYDNSGAGVNSALFLVKNYGATPYTTNDGVGLGFRLDSDSQATNQLAQISAVWNASAPVISLATNINNNTSGPFVNAATFSTAQATLSGDLAVNGGDISTTATLASLFNTTATTINVGGAATTMNVAATGSVVNFGGDINVIGGDITTPSGLGNLFNTNATTVNIGNAATVEVNLGNTGAGQVQIKSPTIVGANTTQAVFNTVATTVNAFGASTATNIGAATGTTTLGNNLDVNGEQVRINANNTAADSYLYFKGSNEYLTWNNTDTRFEFSDQLYISQTDIPAIFERRNVTADINTTLEFKNPLKLTERITDAPDNDTTIAGPGISFSRTSGATDTTERIFAALGAVWDGSTQTVEYGFNWTNDNFAEPTPGNFPGTYTLLRMGSNNSEFYDASLYVDYSAQGTTHTATSITGGNTLVFGSAHGYTAGDRIIYTSTTSNGLTQNAYYYVLTTGLTTTQCQLGLTSNGSAIALTNGTGLTLVFADLINRVGINTDTPAYTLDVNGDLRVTGDIISSGITAGNITVGVVNDNTISTTSGELDITAAAGSIVEITTSLTDAATGPTRITRVTNETNVNIRALTLRTNSTGTPAVGLGASLDYEVETAVGTFTRGGYLEVASTDITSGSEDFVMNFGVTAAGTGGIRASLDNTGTLTLNNDLAVNGGDITTTQTTASVFNTTATTVNAFGAATNITMGVDGATGAGGTTTIRSATTIVKGDLQVNGDNTGVIADITTTKTSASVFNTTATTVNAFGDATTINIGAATGTTTINNDLDVAGNVNAESFTIDGTRVKMDSGNTSAWTAGANIALTTTDKNVQKAIFYITDGTNVHTLELLALRTGAGAGDAMLTTYGEMYSSTSLATFTAEISGGALRIRGTNTTATTLTISIVSTTLL